MNVVNRNFYQSAKFLQKFQHFQKIVDSLEVRKTIESTLQDEFFTVNFRLNLQTISYLFGSWFFFCGSLVFIPCIEWVEVGGWLFTLGSFCFFLIDAIEISRYAHSITRVPQITLLSFCGSLLFLGGSIMFIPKETITRGTEAFVVGSALFTGLSLFRIHESKLQRERCIKHDLVIDVKLISPICIDASAGLGAFLFMVGSVFYLPEIDVSATFSWIAWALFQIGSNFYMISSILAAYKHLCQ